MVNTYSSPPSLLPMKSCDAGLNFYPKAVWPEALPAVACNGLVLAGWGRDLVFNYEYKEELEQKVSVLFRSLYSELSFGESAKLYSHAQNYSWFPFEEVLKKFSINVNSVYKKSADCFLKLPVGFQNWCIDKKVSAGDLAPLWSAQELDLKPVYLQILNTGCNKNNGILALELAIDLLLMGKNLEELIAQELSADEWIIFLKQLRFPDTFARDAEYERQLTNLPWPGSSQARWLRQGDKAGIELKLFVSQPTDLKKYLQSLQKVQELMEKSEDPQKAH